MSSLMPFDRTGRWLVRVGADGHDHGQIQLGPGNDSARHRGSGFAGGNDVEGAGAEDGGDRRIVERTRKCLAGTGTRDPGLKDGGQVCSKGGETDQ